VVRVVNVVAVADLGRPLDLLSLERALPGSVLVDGAPSFGEKLLYRPRGSGEVLIFHRSGKVLALGFRSVERLMEDMKGALAAARAAGVDISRAVVTVQNIVAVARLGRVNLYRLHDSLAEAGAKVYLDPDVFPALVVSAGWFSALVFSSGKVVILGVRSEEEAERALEELARASGGTG